MSAPRGNQNAAKGKEWADALRLALKTYEDKDKKIKRGHALRKIADGVVKNALEGDKDSWQEIGNRLDGKPAQALVGPDGGPLMVERIERVIVSK